MSDPYSPVASAEKSSLTRRLGETALPASLLATYLPPTSLFMTLVALYHIIVFLNQ